MRKRTIRPFGAKTNPSPERLAEFRNYVAQLKRQGILTGKIDPKVARPGFVRGGRKLADIVNKHREKLKPFEPNKKAALSAAKKSSGIPHKHKLPLRSPVSFRDLPLKGRSLGSSLKELAENPKYFDSLKNRDEYFAFEIDGIHSVAVFRDMERLTNYLGNSGGIQHVLSKHGREEQFIYDRIKLVRWNKSLKEWKPKPQKWSKEKLEHARRSRAAKQAQQRRKKNARKR